MSDFWNSKTLKAPTINYFKCKSAIDINNVISILHNGIDTFTIPDALRLESSVMRRVIYRLKLQFRLDKGFKLFENTNRCLNNLLAFNITEDLKYLLDEVPSRYEKDLYFPSKQMLEYVLVRLQGYSQTSSRVVESAFQAAIFMKGRIRLGHQWEIAVVSYAVCSRIWQICKHLTTKCCLLFNELLPLLDKLELAGTKWLPDNYEFPKDLIDWLNYDWLLDKPDIILQLPLELPIFSLLDDDEEDVLYNGGYQLNKSKTIIINDSDDDDDEYFENDKLISNFNNLDQASTKFFDLKSNASTVTLTITDDEINSTKNTSSVDYIFSKKNFAKDKSETENKSTDLVNMSGIIPLDSDDEVIQIDDCIVDENDEGESVSRKDFYQENAKKSKDKIEFNIKNACEADNDIFSDQESVYSDIIENSLSNCTVVDEDSKCKSDSSDDESDVHVEILQNTQSKKLVSESEFKTECLQFSDDESLGSRIENSVINERDIEQNTGIPSSSEKGKKRKKISMYIRLKGFNFKIVSAKDLQNFLDREDSLRESPRLFFLDEEPKTKDGKKDKTCISSHLDDEKWSRLSMEIKYYIAMAMNSFVEKTNLINEAKTMLKEHLNPKDDESAKGENLNEVKKLINSFHTANQLEQYWIKVNKLRKKKNRKKTGLYRNLNTDEWRNLGTVIKNSVKTARELIVNSTYYVQQAKILLKNVLDVKPEIDNVENPDIQIKCRISKNDLNWTKKGRIYFISSLKSLCDLKSFMDKENYLRTFYPQRCIFYNIIDEGRWAKLCTTIKELIDMAHKQPIKSIILIKEAKKILKNPQREKFPNLNFNDSNCVIDTDDNSDAEELRQKYRRKYEHIYNCVTDTFDKKKKDKSSNVNESIDLFDYVRTKIESYEIPKVKGMQMIREKLEKEIKQAKKREKHKQQMKKNENKPMSNRRKRKLMLQEQEENRKRLKSMYYYYY